MPKQDFRPVALAVVRIILRASGLQVVANSLDDAIKIADFFRGNQEYVPSRRQIEGMVKWAQTSLAATFEVESPGAAKNDITAAMLTVAELLNGQISNDLVMNSVVDSSALESQLLAHGGSRMRDSLLSEDSIAAFDIMLRSVCRHLAEVTLSAPEFGPRALQRLLQGQERLETISKQVLGNFDALINSPFTEQDFAAYTSRYLTKIAEQLDFLDIPGIDLDRHRQRYNLTMAYIPIAARSGGSGQFECATLDSLTRIGNFIMVVGDPGSGKSTLLKWAAVEAARSFLHAGKNKQQMVPFLIKLRSLPDSLPDLDEVGAPMTDGLVVAKPPGWSKDLIESGRAMLLFDGLDEVPDDRRESIIRWINQINQDHGRRGTQIIVTSRPAAIREQRFRLMDGVPTTLLPMPHSKIERFVTLWHRSVYAAPEVRDAGDWKAKSDRLLARLEADTQLSHLASNPLLCAVVCSLYHARGEHLPSERSELYEALLAMLLARRDHERRGIETLLSLTDTERLIEDVALAFLLEERDEVSRSDVLDVLRRSLRGFRNHEVRDMRPMRVLDHFVNRTGVLRELPPYGVIDFWHKSFQEFLAARVLIDQGQDRELLSHCSESSWREVIIWACSLMRQSRASSFIKALLNAAESASEEDYKAYLVRMTLSCAHYTLQLDDSVQKRLEELAKTLVAPIRPGELGAISQLGAVAVPILADALCKGIAIKRQHVPIEELISTLTTIGGEAVNSVLAGMPDAFKREWALSLAEGWSSTGSEDYARRVLGSVPYDEKEDKPVLVKIESLRQLRSIDYLSPVYRPSVRIYWNGFDREDLGPGSTREVSRVALSGELGWADVASFLECYPAAKELNVILSRDLLTWNADESFSDVRSLDLDAKDAVILNLDALAVFPNLETLRIFGSISIIGSKGFSGNPLVTTISIETSGSLAEVKWEGDVESLSVFPWPYASLKELVALKSLQKLDLSESEALQSLDGVRDLPELTDLDVSDCEMLKNADDALFSPSLTNINIEGSYELSSAEFMYINVMDGEDSLARLDADSPTPDYIADRWMYDLSYEGLSDGEIEVRGWDDWSFWEEIKGGADEWLTPNPVNQYEESLKADGLTLYDSFDEWIERQAEDTGHDELASHGLL